MKYIFVFFFSLFLISTANAGKREINFVVHYKTVDFAGTPRKAIAVNNQIPAPMLHFKEGDTVTINVTNQLDEETAIHWHGIILPWQMDGVLGISQHGIQPGQVFQYKFTLRQSGTYWYHAHAGLQEQQGLYGAFIIDPASRPAYHYNKDYTVVLSDWSNTHPNKILANLKKDGDYYSPDFPLQPSLIKFIHDYRKASAQERTNLIDDYKMMQQMRMSIYDLSDVAYDAFLLNGQPISRPWRGLVKVGDVVRLRFIGAGGNSIFHVKIPNTEMQIIQIDGNDVKPYVVRDFTIASGETYDVLVKIKKQAAYIIYAESIDKVGKIYGALTTSTQQQVNFSEVIPFPEPLPVTREMMQSMMGSQYKANLPISLKNPKMETVHKSDMAHGIDGTRTNHMHGQKEAVSLEHQHKTLNNRHAAHNTMNDMDTESAAMKQSMSMDMPTEPTQIGDSILPGSAYYETSMGTKYDRVKAATKTNNPNMPVAGVINMELFGYMDRYIWFINGLPEYDAPPLVLEPGKRYRFVFKNTSMMHHPMHIHGHWFILRKGQGAYDPLLHTIDVPPGATITADVDTDASGQWIFHCHMLYHMAAGMARAIQYSTLIDLIQDEATPEHFVQQSQFVNRPIVREDEVLPIQPLLVHHPMMEHPALWLATFIDAGVNPLTNVQKLTYKGLYGPDYHKLELSIDDAERIENKVDNANIDIFYWRLLDQFWAVKGGINYTNRPTKTPYWQPGLGIEGLMPYYIDTDIKAYLYSGSAKLDIELSRDTQITNNFFIRLGINGTFASKTVANAEIGAGLNQIKYTIRPYYRIMPGLNVFMEFEREQAYGRFKALKIYDGENATQNLATVGIAMLF